MTDPGGGYGWRSGERPGASPYSLRGRAARAELEEQTPLCVLLLPRELERFILRDQAEDLLTAPGVVAIEPARVPYGAYLRLGPGGPAGRAGAPARGGGGGRPPP